MGGECESSIYGVCFAFSEGTSGVSEIYFDETFLSRDVMKKAVVSINSQLLLQCNSRVVFFLAFCSLCRLSLL